MDDHSSCDDRGLDEPSTSYLIAVPSINTTSNAILQVLSPITSAVVNSAEPVAKKKRQGKPYEM